MNWSVVSQRKSDAGKGIVLDVIARGGKNKFMSGVTMYKIALEGSKAKRHLGTVIKNNARYGRETWTAVPYDLYPRTVNGFSRRRDAIEYMLKDQGYYWDENSCRSAGQLNHTNIGSTIVYTYHNANDEIDQMEIGPITAIQHVGRFVQVHVGKQMHTLPYHGVIREVR